MIANAIYADKTYTHTKEFSEHANIHLLTKKSKTISTKSNGFVNNFLLINIDINEREKQKGNDKNHGNLYHIRATGIINRVVNHNINKNTSNINQHYHRHHHITIQTIT